jgi:hypothetical protein
MMRGSELPDHRRSQWPASGPDTTRALIRPTAAEREEAVVRSGATAVNVAGHLAKPRAGLSSGRNWRRRLGHAYRRARAVVVATGVGRMRGLCMLEGLGRPG